MATEFEGRLTSALQATGVVGASLGVLSGDDVEIAHAGLADAGRSTDVDGGTRFQIASVTKPMVATVIAKLATEGKLRLEDAAATRIPEVQGSSWGERVTVLDLLANRAGVPLTAAVEFEFDAEGEDCLARLAAAVAREPLLFEPRTAWSYSNTGCCLLGRMIEVVSGMSWEEAMRRELFDPLEMGETCFISEGPIADAAACYERRGGDEVAVEPWRHRALGPAGATVWSTVRDLLRFARLHLDDGLLPDGSRFAPPTVLASLRKVEERRSLPDFMDGWARGWAQWAWPGAAVWGWCGIAEGHRAILKIIPTRNAAVALTANSSHGRELYRRLFPPLLADRFGVTMPRFERLPAAGFRGDLQPYAGTYAWPDYQFVVRAQQDRLSVRSPELEGDALPVTERVFAFSPDDPDVPVIVFDDFDTHGCPQMLYSAVWGYPRVE